VNTLDAIISLTILFASIGVLVNSLAIQSETNTNSDQLIKAKTTSLICATTIDSIYSNSAKSYTKSVDCIPQENKLISKINNTQKESYSITTAQKNTKIEVKTNAHYLE
jgi:hypothetical protein